MRLPFRRRRRGVYTGPVVWHNDDLCHYPIAVDADGYDVPDTRQKLLWDDELEAYVWWDGKGSSHIGRYHQAEATIEAD